MNTHISNQQTGFVFHAILIKKYNVRESLFVNPRKQTLSHAIEKHDNDGFVLASDLVNIYKEKLAGDDLIKSSMDMECELAVFRKVVKVQIMARDSKYSFYYPNRHSGSMFYNSDIFSERSAPIMYGFLTDRKQLKQLNEPCTETV